MVDLLNHKIMACSNLVFLSIHHDGLGRHWQRGERPKSLSRLSRKTRTRDRCEFEDTLQKLR